MRAASLLSGSSARSPRWTTCVFLPPVDHPDGGRGVYKSGRMDAQVVMIQIPGAHRRGVRMIESDGGRSPRTSWCCLWPGCAGGVGAVAGVCHGSPPSRRGGRCSPRRPWRSHGADARAGCRGRVEPDAMTTGFAAIAAGAPRTRLGQGNGEGAQSVTPARRWSMPIFMAVFGPKMLMIEGGACAVLRRLCRQ
jgi:hypothetical protein